MTVLTQGVITRELLDQVGFGVVLNPDGSIAAVLGPTIGATPVDPNGVRSGKAGSLLLGFDAAAGTWQNTDGATAWARLSVGSIPVLPLAVVEGGTGATTAEGARANLGAASETDVIIAQASAAATAAAIQAMAPHFVRIIELLASIGDLPVDAPPDPSILLPVIVSQLEAMAST